MDNGKVNKKNGASCRRRITHNLNYFFFVTGVFVVAGAFFGADAFFTATL